jgi:hypothetical protein
LQVSKDAIVERSVSHFREADRDHGERVLREISQLRERR